MPDAEINVRDVDFGRLDAESDRNLHNYFVDTGVIERIGKGQKQFIIGRKGSGKTALFQQPGKAISGSHVVNLEFSDYAWESHKAIAELGLPLENAYTASWIFTFLVSACRKWMTSVDETVAKKAKKTYLDIYGAEGGGGGLLDILFDRFKRVRKLEGPAAGDLVKLGAIEIEGVPEGAHLAFAANAWNRKLIELADELFKTKPISIFVDRLDDGWDASAEMKAMLAGAIKAARSLNLRYAAARPPAIVLFLRSDIYAHLEFNDKNKIGADIEHVVWDQNALLDIANARIARSIPVKKSEAWAAVFSDKQMRQRAYISNYILKRTMLRPRDLIAFCIYCKEAAVANGHTKVEPEDVYDAEVQYSKHVYDELVDEMHKQVPYHETIFRALNKIGYSRFNFATWEKALTEVGANGADSMHSLKLLFEYAVVGVPRVGGKGGGSKYEFIYQNRFLEPRFDGDIVVHPALRKHLNLKDAMPADADQADED
ncbi:hypothetical protein RDV84_15595 [Lysobacter yananisis]|uniref:ATP-binding protein n=1 Tax=Lysobacter yananisis TaxID=1003114 RepID=A0ABY9P4Y8_9GAMM|nr:hypothetical protein [Lysobacter yananisis]WMT01408.1 hypothetical protein RDV84_15595 [Lysobacter yananisis]